MDEVVAEVVEEKVPEPPKFEPFIVQWIGADHGALPFKTLAQAEKEAADCRSDGFPARILRVQPPSPPKKQRVEIDFLAMYKWLRGIGYNELAAVISTSDRVQDAIERHARIVEEPKR